MKAIEIEGLTKQFKEVVAVDHLNLSVEQGSIFGLLGPNGAGKTTTLRLLMGLARPTSGTARILGEDIRGDTLKIRKRIGYLPDVPAFYGWMNGREYLTFVGEFFHIPKTDLNKRVDSLLGLAGLAEVKTHLRGYSRGMKQRLGVAQALINEPELLFLDEPTSALDPIGRREVLEMILSLRGRTTVFLSTHILNDVERVCDTVGILNKGRLATEENLDSLKAKYVQPVFLLEFDYEPLELEATLADLPWVVSQTRENNLLRVVTRDLTSGQRELPRLIAESSLPLRNFQVLEPSLEEIFVKVVQ
jgi:ABC-2 type transport system ATP-binding protein